jgi:hypothetical protein
VIGPPDFHRDTHRCGCGHIAEEHERGSCLNGACRCDVTPGTVRTVGTRVRIPVWRRPWADR